MRVSCSPTICITDILLLYLVGKALIAISKEANPPLRLPLGADSHFVIQSKLAAIQKELDEWKELELSVVADDADPHFFDKVSATV